MDFFDDEMEDDFDDDFDMSEFNGHLKGKRCDQCGSEEIYFDGDQYECSCCGKIWIDEDDIGDYIPDELEVHDNMLKNILESEKRMFSNSITKYNLKSLFSPLTRFFKNQEMNFNGEIPEIKYTYLLTQAMAEKPSYEAAKNVEVPEGITAADREKYFYGFMQDYMSAIGELPYKPTPKDWAQFLKIDESEVMNFFPSEDLDLEPYITSEGVIDNFSVIFSKKIKNIDDDAYEMCNGPINMDQSFSMYLCWKDSNYGFIMNHFLADEVKIAKKYIEGYQTKKAEFLQNAKDKNLSVIDTIMQFVYYAFDGSDIKL